MKNSLAVEFVKRSLAVAPTCGTTGRDSVSPSFLCFWKNNEDHEVYPIKHVNSFVLLCFVWDMLYVSGRRCDALIYPYCSGLLHWHWGNRTIAPVPVKLPLRKWVDRPVPHPNQTHRSLNREHTSGEFWKTNYISNELTGHDMSQWVFELVKNNNNL